MGLSEITCPFDKYNNAGSFCWVGDLEAGVLEFRWLGARLFGLTLPNFGCSMVLTRKNYTLVLFPR